MLLEFPRADKTPVCRLPLLLFTSMEHINSNTWFKGTVHYGGTVGGADYQNCSSTPQTLRTPTTPAGG